MFVKSGILPVLLLTAALLCAGAALAQDEQGGQSGNAADLSFTDAAGTLGVGEFSSAVQGAGLSDLLNNQGVLILGAGSFVIFAPSDEAIAASGLDMNAALENATELARILEHHVVWNDGSFGDISEVSSARTLQGENLTIENADGLKVNGASATEKESYQGGIIYVVDSLLLPETGSSLGVVEAARNLGAGKFADAVDAAGLAGTLNGQGLMGIGGLAGGPFTVFAPSDEAFESEKATIDAVSKQEGGMASLLSYHVVDAAGLTNMTETNSVKTMLGDSLAVDPQAGLVGGAYVLKSERFNNGIVYVIDRVLVPIRLSMS